MNTLESKIQSESIQAIKDKNKVKSETLKSIKAAIMQAKTAPGANKDLDDSDIIKIIKKLAKQRSEAASLYEQNGRPELAQNEKAELEVLNEYLPKMLTESEIENIVISAIANFAATSMKDMGKVMGYINKQYAGQVDGSVVAKIVKEKLS